MENTFNLKKFLSEGRLLKEAVNIAFGDYYKIYSDIAKTGDLEQARQAVIDALPDFTSPKFSTPEEAKKDYADMVADTYRVNQPKFKGEGEKGYWNGWRLGYAEDTIFFIKPAVAKRPWLDGRVKGNIAIIIAQDNEPKAVNFLQAINKQIGGVLEVSDVNTIELKVKEQDLQNLFNF